MDPLFWAILLMLLGIVLVVLEIFIPSGGILGFLAFAAVLASVYLAFSFSGTTAGVAFGGFAVVALPLTITLSLNLLPRTSFGRRLLLMSDDDALAADEDDAAMLRELIGEVGEAKTLMLPGGMVKIGRRTYEAVSEGSVPIEPKQAIEVVQVRHERLVVRPTTLKPPRPDLPADEDDIMNKPLDSLGLDDIDEPLS